MANITKRLTVGRPLTNAEVDANFDNLNTQKVEKDGTTVMTGTLKGPGIQAQTAAGGVKIYNQAGVLVATAGANNSTDLIIEGNIDVGGAGGEGANINLNGGDVQAKNLYLTGRVLSSELNVQFDVGNVGDVYTGTAAADPTTGKLKVTLDTIVKTINNTGVFVVGQTVTGENSQTSGVLTRIDSTNALHIRLTNPTKKFDTGERIIQSGSSGSIYGYVSETINTGQLNSGHRMKIFGVSLPTARPVDAAEVCSVAKVGTAGGTQYTYYYWITQFRMDNGQISAARKVGSVSHGDVSLFNAATNITMTLARTSTDYGIAVYRAKEDNIASARLVEVLGPDSLGASTSNITYIDYGTYSNTEWSTKDGNGQFTAASNIVHFPLAPNSVSRLGWETLEVDSVTNASVIMFKSAVNFNSGGAIELVHDNTVGLQNAINTNRDLSLRNIVLPNGTYYTSRLDVPSNFVVLGSGKLTIVKQIPWNFDHYNDVLYPTNKGNIFKSQDQYPSNIYFRDLTIDGNFTNQVRFNEMESNYAISLPSATNLNLENVDVTSVPGGGLYAYNTDGIRIQNSEFTNGSLAYRGNDLCPLYAGSSTQLTINGNVFNNFVSPVDVSTSTIGVVVGNTVHNCGSGLLIYGSGSLVSSPNLLMGPDSEFLPSPDTQDSDYNSINIKLDPGVDYISPSFLYMSRGTPVYLGSVNRTDANGVAIPGTAVTLSSDIFVLTKLNNQEISRTAWDYSTSTPVVGGASQPIINIITPDTGDFGRNNGYCQFRITKTSGAELPNFSMLLSTWGHTFPYGEQMIGLVYRVKATGYTYTDTGEQILINSGVFASTYNSVAGKYYTITLSNINDYPIFSIGDKVKLINHSSTPSIVDIESTVIDKIDAGTNIKKIVIKLPDSVSLTTTANGAATGYVTIQNTVIIAKGRIL